MLSVAIDDRAIMKTLGKIAEKQFKFAQAVALTRTAKFAQMDVRSQAAKVFENPTPFTLNSTYTRPATPSRPVAEVGFRGGSDRHFLAPQVQGGNRSHKRFEYHLRQAGVIHANDYIAPAKGFPLDAYGNIPRNVYSAILSDLKAHPDELAWSSAESRRKRTRRKKIAKRAVYFYAGPKSHLPLGIYQRVRTGFGSAIRGVFMVVEKPQYRIRLPLQSIVQQSINLHLEQEFDKAFDKAMATAR